MRPEKSMKICGPDPSRVFLVEQFWWSGRYVVYVNHQISDEDFENTAARIRLSGRFQSQGKQIEGQSR